MWTNGQLWMDRLIARGNGHCSVLVRANENEHTTRLEAEQYKAEVDAFGPLGMSGWQHHASIVCITCSIQVASNGDCRSTCRRSGMDPQ